MNIVLKGQRVGGLKNSSLPFLFELLNETISLGASAQSSANQPPTPVSSLLLLSLISLLSPSLLAVLRIAQHCLPGALCPSHAGSKRLLSKWLYPDSYALAYLIISPLAEESVTFAALHMVPVHFWFGAE